MYVSDTIVDWGFERAGERCSWFSGSVDSFVMADYNLLLNRVSGVYLIFCFSIYGR